MRGAGSSWRQRGLTRCRTSVASSSSSSSSSRATDDDDAELRYVYVGNFDYFDAVEDVRAFILDALRGVVADDAGAGADDDASSSLASRAISVAGPGWTEKTLADGTVKPRKRRDVGSSTAGSRSWSSRPRARAFEPRARWTASRCEGGSCGPPRARA